MTETRKILCEVAIVIGLVGLIVLLLGLFPFNDRAVFWALSAITLAISVNLILRPKVPEQTSPE
jgi:hypothetical protein